MEFPNYSLEDYNKIYDPEYVVSMGQKCIQFLNRFYFRAEIHGLDKIPEKKPGDNPNIFVGNHSGFAFAWDGIVFGSLYAYKHYYKKEKFLRGLVHPLTLFKEEMNPFLIKDWWIKGGGIDATLRTFDAIMQKNNDVVIYPEGVGGIAKGFDKRYQLQFMSPSFIRMALKYKSKIVPVVTVNGEYLNPYSYKSDFLNDIAHKIGMTFLPLAGTTFLLPFQPWSLYGGLPAKLTYIVGDPIDLNDYTEGKPFREIRKKEQHAMRDLVQERMQNQLDQAVRQYGDDPYNTNELIDLWLANMDKIMYILPTGWPVLFNHHFRNWQKGHDMDIDYSNTGFLKALAENLDQMGYFVPFLSWPLVFLGKRIEKLQIEMEKELKSMKKPKEI